MKIISYVHWDQPGEKDKFIELIKMSKNNDELKENIIKTFGVDKATALTCTIKFRNLINKYQKKL